MSATITTIARESIGDFIKRHPTGVFTNDVAIRFGMYQSDALKELKRMETARRNLQQERAGWRLRQFSWRWPSVALSSLTTGLGK